MLNKIVKFSYLVLNIFSRKLATRMAWNSVILKGNWYDDVKKNPCRNLSNEMYKEYVDCILKYFTKETVVVELGGGEGRVLNFILDLSKKNGGGGRFINVDYSERRQINSKEVQFICTDVMKFNNWMNETDKGLKGNIIFVVYGFFMYLDSRQLSELLNRIFSHYDKKMGGVTIVGIEPTLGNDIPKRTCKSGDSFYHNYAHYLGKSNIKSAHLLDDNYFFFCAHSAKKDCTTSELNPQLIKF
jgi:hypothetical protein